MVQVYFDGLCQPINPGGIACYGFLVKSDEKTIYSERGLATEPFSRGATNNVAEYIALIKALEWLLANSMEQEAVQVLGDSRLVINQMRGEFKVKSKAIKHLFQRAAELKRRFTDITFQWVPREKNREADKLSEEAYNKMLLDDPKLLDRVMK